VVTVRAIDTLGRPSVAQEWPLRSYRELRGMPVSVRFARLHARKVLYKWHIGVITDTVELLVSEITTNAIRASADSAGSAPRVGLWLTSDRRSVLIQVWDGNRREPRCRDAGPDAEGGRGLQLVEALSAQWGCYAAAWPGGDGPGGSGSGGSGPDGSGPDGDGPDGDGLSGKIVWALCAE
jgi:Histidine kinase-like ATPase domain